jgi:hydroxymethylpyrimidine/phosphomethylpyrimidine kinase
VHELSKLHLIAIGGLDPSGGSGILRDGLTARALGSRFRLVGTAWAEQSAAHGVQAIDARPRQEVTKAIALALNEAPDGLTAVKIGMVVNAELVGAIATALTGFRGPVVFDPVLGATAGGALFDRADQSLMDALSPLLRRCTVFTPNAQEAALLCDSSVQAVEESEMAARLLVDQGLRAVVIKGGHLQTAHIADVLLIEGRLSTLTRPRVAGPNVRGTGCSYASSLALYLAGGASFERACESAQAHVADAIGKAVAFGSEWHLGHSLQSAP